MVVEWFEKNILVDEDFVYKWVLFFVCVFLFEVMSLFVMCV